MKINIENTIKYNNNYEGLNAIIEHALKCKSSNEFDKKIQSDDRIQDDHFFIYLENETIDIYELTENALWLGNKSNRLLFIHP